MSSEANDVFRIDSMTLKNFRCFEERTIEFAPQFNVVIGENGSGKTAVLDGLRYALGRLAPDPGTHELPSRLTPSDARLVTQPTESLPHLQAIFPVALTYEGILEGTSVSAALEWSHAAEAVRLSMKDYIAPYFGTSAPDQILPLLAYYTASRFSREPTATADDPLGQEPRVHGYKDCLAAVPDEMHFLRWAKRVEFVRAQEGRPFPAWEAVKASVAHCVPDCRDMTYRALDDHLTVDLVSGETLPLDLLPAGVRGMLSMVADLAWRAAFLNPQFGAEAVRETPGVVLIDEIDLHLHPKWQQRVVDDLKHAFPKVQFIATTHSPFIIQSLGDMATTNDRLIVLDDEDTVPDHPYAKSSIEDIAEDLQGVTDPPPQRSRRYWEMVDAAEEYYRLLEEADGADDAEKERLKQRLDELSERYGDDPAYLALLRAETKAAGLGVSDE